MSLRKAILATALALAALATVPAGASAVTPKPAWSIQSLSTPTNFTPGDESGLANYQSYITNNGGKATDQSPITVTDTLPAGLVVSGAKLFVPRNVKDVSKAPVCKTTVEPTSEVSTVSCEITDAIEPKTEPSRFDPGNAMLLEIAVKVPASVSGTLRNRVQVEGGGAEAAVKEAENQASAEEAPAGFEEFQAELTGADGRPASAASSHPYQYTTSFGVNLVPAPPSTPAGTALQFIPAQGDLKHIEVALPPGLAANPTAVPRCSAKDFTDHHMIVQPLRNNFITSNDCPPASVVGVAIVEQLEGSSFFASGSVPIYNLVPPKGMPGQLGFEISNGPIYINTRLRSDGDYGVSAFLDNVTEAKRVTASRIMIWGTPWDESHDAMRGECTFSWETCPLEGGLGTPRPFLRVPSSCTAPLLTAMSFTTWAQPATGGSASSVEAARTACAAPPFDPTIESRPTTSAADSPTGLHFKLHLPQAANEDPEGLGEADLRDAHVTLPPGLVANPAQADGLAACSPAQAGLTTAPGQSPIHFDTSPAECPAASKLGLVRANVPALDHPLEGAVYLASQEDNPFGSLLAIYIVFEDEQTGVVVKLAAKVSPDPATGQLTTTVAENPQVPFEDFEFDFFEGARGPLRTAATCATYTTTTDLTPWSAPEGSSAFPSDSFATSAPAPGQATCPTSPAELPNEPRFEAGTESPKAGAFSPLVVNLRRGEGSQEFGQLTLTPPPGLLARLAGIPYCSEAALAAAASASGRSELSSPACPAASQVGTATVGAGAGPTPYYVTARAYLAGPYRGAPLSLAIVTPAVAGPFDLGTVVVRTALHIDPASTRIEAVSDPIPHILRGIPLDVRSVSVRLDHPGWGLNPTSCEEKAFDGALRSTLDATASLHDRFQVGDCAGLGFKPALSLRLRGKTARAGFPALHAAYVPRAGDANLKEMVLRFPKSEFIEQGHFRTICTRVQWAAGAGGGQECPPGSIYGRVRAFTPLLDAPLEGPVYLRSSNHELPDVVFALRGQVSAEVSVRVDSVNGGLRATIESAPDVPVSKVVLDMQGGKKGLFVNSRDICSNTYRAAARLSAQSGATGRLRPALRGKCKGASKRHAGRGR